MYSLFTHECVATHASNSIIKVANATTVVGLISNNDETAYREEVRADRGLQETAEEGISNPPSTSSVQ